MSRLPLKEEDEVVRHVRENDVTDVAADVEPSGMQWADHLGRHSGLLSAGDYYAAAAFRGIGDSPEMRLLVGGGVGVDLEILQHRPQHDINFVDCEFSAHAPACSASERQPCWCRLLGAPEAVRIESFGVREDFRILVQIGNAHKHVVIVRDPPLAEIEVRRTDPAAGQVDDGPYPQHLQISWPGGNRCRPRRLL